MNLNFNPFPELKSNRLILKQLSEKHALLIFTYQSNKENFPYVEMPIYNDVSQALQYIRKMNAGILENKWIIWAICLAENERIIGTISLWNLNLEKDLAELGYGIFPEYRHNGYMHEALELAVRYGFDMMELKAIEAYTNHSNIPSKNVLKKMNFQFVKTIKDEYSNGALMDVFIIHSNHR